MDETQHASTSSPIELTADLVAAYVSNNNVPMSELAALIAKVHAALTGLGNEAPVEPVSPEKATAAQIKKSVTPDALISFEDGKSYKTLRRHLTLRGLTPEAYRTKYGLPADYPMTTANYSAQRSELARSLGLGQMRRKSSLKATSLDEIFAATPATRGGRAKADSTS
ncbi:MucR family transcriptional regulator [Methylobacterium sp. E-041]|uniref:MucR family transcriptional regulator n=1 Tax=Methylobacterium sp. E-041 TaxID=2836573 RepID=UPI001FB987C1|nr:MucR family transcriptional regulator [Methylobacterium sp. E-041]MCJ2107329.1 MucR family transcriptional regulator [Methylobacterium sp. E-041]